MPSTAGTTRALSGNGAQPAWTSALRPSAGPYRARLVAFPHSAAGPNTLLPLMALLPGWIQVLGVTLPGRERRFGEPPGTTVTEVVSCVRRELSDPGEAPTFLFGHSLGGYLAYCLAMSEPGCCAGLILSGLLPERPPGAIEATASDADFLAFLRENTAPELLADDLWREHLLQLVRHDVDLASRAARAIAAGLVETPVTALGGADDPQVDAGRLGTWAGRTTRRCRVRAFPGGHFYLLEPGNLAAVAETIAGTICATAQSSSRPVSSLSER